MSKKQKAVIDPELERQLAQADGNGRVGAAFTLRAPEDAPLIEESEVRQMVDRIVKSAQASSGEKIHDVNVMPRIQSFAVEAPAGVVRAIMGSSEIASATANQQ